MRRGVSIWPVMAILGCLLVAFIWSGGQLRQSIQEVDQKYEQNSQRLRQLQNDQVALKELLEASGTKAFIENQARTEYGFMKPDEIRFVITNPEALYGTEGVPAR